MFVPLVDILRCPNAHADTWLVASIDRAVDRDIVTGILGCPVCSAEYPIRDGVVDFGFSGARAPYAAPNESDAVRLAAGLDLTDARVVAVLHGAWGAHAPLIRSLSPAQLLLVNPPAGVVSGDGVSIVEANAAPLASASVHAVAYDPSADEAMIASLLGALRGGGRLLAHVDAMLPHGFTELARDPDVWVAARDAMETTSAPVGISRKLKPRDADAGG